MMKLKKVISYILIILVLACFTVMVVGLFQSNFSLFYAAGGALGVFLIAGYAFSRAIKKKEEREKQMEEDEQKPAE